MDTPEPRPPSQQIGQAEKSAISFSGNASVTNNQFITNPKPWKPPLMLPPQAQSFVGREEDLDWLLQKLHTEKMTTLTLCGPGGMGKTALAAEALSRLIDQGAWSHRFPDGIFYHSFYSYPSLEVAFEELARTFEEEPGGDPFLSAKRAMSRRQALLVFDGVETLEDSRPLQDLGGRNIILLLSRHRSDAPYPSNCYDLGQLPLDQSIILLQDLAGSRAKNETSVTRLLKLIGGYPLAIKLIGGHLFSHKQEIAEYLQWLESTGMEAIHFGKHPDQSVPVLLQHTYETLTPHEQHLFLIQGLLAPAPFPVELVQAILGFSEQETRYVIGELVNANLISRLDQNYEVSHPLIHTFAKECISSQRNVLPFPSVETLTIWQERLLRILTTHFDQGDRYHTTALTLWLPHVLPLLSKNNLTDEQRLKSAHIFNIAGVKSYTQGKYAEAETLLEHALAIYKQLLGFIHSYTAQNINNLANLYWDQGRYIKGEPLLKQALEIYDQLGSNHLNKITSLNNLANLYRSQGRYTEAEPLLQQALAISKQQSGATHPMTAASFNNLARLYRTQGKYTEAEPLYKLSLAIREQILGATHPETAQSLNDLAILYRMQGKYTEAEALYKRSVEIYDQMEANHYDKTTSLNNLAVLYRSQGKYAEAELLYKRSLATCEQHLGITHPITATSLNNLAELYWSQGKYAEAEPLYKRALTIRKQILGANHTETAQSLNNLANLYLSQSKYTEAEPLFQQAIAIHEQQLGPQHPDTATSLNNLAALYRTQGKYPEAEPLLKRALTIFTQQVGREHPNTQQVMRNYLTLLAEIHTGGDIEALLTILRQENPDSDT